MYCFLLLLLIIVIIIVLSLLFGWGFWVGMAGGLVGMCMMGWDGCVVVVVVVFTKCGMDFE